MVLNIKLIICYLLYLPQIIAFVQSDSSVAIKEDVERWLKEMECRKKMGDITCLIYVLFFKPQFRNLFYFRCPKIPKLLRLFCKPDSTIEIAQDGNDIVGGGLYFEHATATHIACKKMGYGCRFRQLTTLGVKSGNRHDDKPTIGNNVDFGVNVTCIGNITIGDNAIIGAGSVVVKDIPANAIAVGNPAKVVKFRTDIPNANNILNT